MITTIEQAEKVLEDNSGSIMLMLSMHLALFNQVDGGEIKRVFGIIKKPISDTAAQQLADNIMAARPEGKK